MAPTLLKHVWAHLMSIRRERSQCDISDGKRQSKREGEREERGREITKVTCAFDNMLFCTHVNNNS